MQHDLVCWTDYPCLSLGDIGGQKAPIRQATLVAYDRNKYAVCIVEDILLYLKAYYLYSEPGRCGDVPGLSQAILESVPRGVGRLCPVCSDRSDQLSADDIAYLLENVQTFRSAGTEAECPR